MTLIANAETRPDSIYLPYNPDASVMYADSLRTDFVYADEEVGILLEDAEPTDDCPEDENERIVRLDATATYGEVSLNVLVTWFDQGNGFGCFVSISPVTDCTEQEWAAWLAGFEAAAQEDEIMSQEDKETLALIQAVEQKKYGIVYTHALN